MKKLFVIFIAVAMVGAFAATAVAAEWSFYGSARMTTFVTDTDKAQTALGLFNDTDTTWDLQGNTRFGAKVDAGDVKGRMEMAVDDDAGVNTRLLYGEWNFGSGKLLVGQYYSPTDSFYANQVGFSDADLLGWGQAYDGREPMIRLSFGDFKIAFMEPDIGGTTTGVLAATETDTTLPKINASYNFKSDTFFLDVYGGYQSYDLAVTATDKEYSIDSWIVGVGGGTTFGPVYVKLGVNIAQNKSAHGMAVAEAAPAVYNAAIDDFDDSDSLAYVGVIGFKVSDTLKLEVGYGANNNEIDQSGVETENDAQAYYANAVITFAPGVFIVPEIGKRDYDDTSTAGVSTDQGDITYYGLKWQINF